MFNQGKARVCLLLLIVILAVTLNSAAASPASVTGENVTPLSPDATYMERQNQALANLAERFSYRSYAASEMVDFGFDTTYLVAKFELNERGLPGGLSPNSPEAIKYINNFAEHALKNLGTRSKDGPWSWASAGSPAVMHGAMSLGFILHQWGNALPAETVEMIQRVFSETSWWNEMSMEYMVNGRISITAGMLLAGEYFGYDSKLWKHAMQSFTGLYANAMKGGTIEMNAPTYSKYHYPPLMLLQSLNNEPVRNKARTLLDYELLVSGHLYLPGGGLGAPQARDYAGGASDNNSLAEMYSLLFDDPEVSSSSITTPHAIGAASDYVPYPVLRSIFLDKGDGYTFWTYTDAPVGRSRLGNGYYRLGRDGRDVAPWQVVMMPGGEAMMGFSYGMRYQSIHVSFGVYVKDQNDRFQILYQYQPWIEGDRSEMGRGMPTTSGDTDPDDFTREGMERERMLYGRTLIQIWDPKSTTYKDTRVHLPNWDKYGGAMIKADGWYVGQMGRNYIAFRPLGTIEAEEERSGGLWTYMRLPGRSGSIIELANTDQFATLQDYVADLKTRHLVFANNEGSTAYYAEFDALDPQSGEKVRMRLDYAPERRFVDGQEVTMDEMDRGLISSKFVSWDAENYAMTLSRPGYETVRYDWDDGIITAGEEDGPRAEFVEPRYGQVLREKTGVKVQLKEFTPRSVEVTLDGSTVYTGEQVPAPDEVVLDPVKLAEGTHTLRLTATGDDGAEVTKALGFSVPVKIAVISPGYNEVTRGTLPIELSATNLLSKSVEIRVDDVVIYSGQALPSGLSLNTLDSEEGGHNLDVTVVDAFDHKINISTPFSINNWRAFADFLEPPVTSGFFGVVDRSRTSSTSDGWGYSDEPTKLFGDSGRRVRLADTWESLVWETTKLSSFQIDMYAKAGDISKSVIATVSRDQKEWQPVHYQATVVESQADGWQKIRLQAQVPAGIEANWLRLELGNYSPAQELQLGRLECTVSAAN